MGKWHFSPISKEVTQWHVTFCCPRACAGSPCPPWLCGRRQGGREAQGRPAAAYTISGPFTHDNLTIFLLHGKDTLSGKPLLTLQEALEAERRSSTKPRRSTS